MQIESSGKQQNACPTDRKIASRQCVTSYSLNYGLFFYISYRLYLLFIDIDILCTNNNDIFRLVLLEKIYENF